MPLCYDYSSSPNGEGTSQESMGLLDLITPLPLTLPSPHEGPVCLSIANIDYIVSALLALGQGCHTQHDLKACFKRQSLGQRWTKVSCATPEICRINFISIKQIKFLSQAQIFRVQHCVGGSID